MKFGLIENIWWLHKLATCSVKLNKWYEYVLVWNKFLEEKCKEKRVTHLYILLRTQNLNFKEE